MRWMFVAVTVVCAASAARAQMPKPVDLAFLTGDWTISDSQGAVVGSATIKAQWPGAVLFEQRTIGEHNAQPLWFVNSESHGGWQQLFVGVTNLVREFSPKSAKGEWPLVLGGDITLRDGTAARFRLTLGHESDDQSRRVLEESVDGGATWTTVFDYTYRRKTGE